MKVTFVLSSSLDFHLLFCIKREHGELQTNSQTQLAPIQTCETDPTTNTYNAYPILGKWQSPINTKSITLTLFLSSQHSILIMTTIVN